MSSPVIPMAPRPARGRAGRTVRGRLRALMVRGRRGTTVAVLCALLAVPASLAAWALSAPAGAVGHDVSYPQCGTSLPSAGTFGIVGVNGGKVSTSNPCLATQSAWASAKSGGAALYVNTGNPGSISTFYWPRNGDRDPALCTDRTSSADPGCAYDYGWHGAENSLQIATNALGAGVTARSWWLDVELANSWNGTTTANAASLQGAVDRLRTAGIGTVGIYSTSYQWGQITGGYRSATAATYRSAWAGAFTPRFPMETAPLWIAGLSTPEQATANCSTSFTGAPALIAQYTDGSLDGDVMCGGASAPPVPTPPTTTSPTTTPATTSPTTTSPTTASPTATPPSGTTTPAAPPATTTPATTTPGTTAPPATTTPPLSTTPAPPPPAVPTAAPTALRAVPGDATVALTWTPPPGVSGVTYTVTRSGPGTTAATVVAAGVATPSWTDRAVTNEATYTYRVAAATSAGTGPASAPVTAKPSRTPGAPTGVVARTHPVRGIALSWAAPAFTGGSPITGYYVLRGTASGRETVLGRLACTTATCSWQDTAITGGRTAYYQVVAVNAANVPGPRSVEVSARGR